VSIDEAALLGLESVLNGVLALDPQARARLAGFHGRVIGIEIRGVGLRFFLVADAAGRLQVLARIEGEADCLMRGTPLDLLRGALSRHKEDALFSGRLEISGDTGLAQDFSEVLARLDIDWEDQLSKLTGDVVAHETGRAVRAAGRWVTRTGGIAEQDLREYLQEEARLVPTRFEVVDWQEEVDRLRDDVDRLAARVARLAAAARASGEPE
jgi:ubiquinone biosynthesis protein UbiJ